MARKKTVIPEYGTVVHNGIEYYRTRIKDADGKLVALYAETREELYNKVQEARRMIDDAIFRKANPTVEEYCEKWLLMKSATIRPQTLRNYRIALRKYVVEPIGHMYMDEVTTDDLRVLMVPVSKCQLQCTAR